VSSVPTNESSVPGTDGVKLGPGRIVATIVLALLALVCFGLTGKYLLAQQHHAIRIVGSFFFAVAFAIGAWFALRYQSLAAEEAREAERIEAVLAATSQDSASSSDAVAAEEAVTAEAAVGAGQQVTAATQA
jgi:hypothetical protein